MQVNATILAAQQAAREARAALVVPKPGAASFLTELKAQDAPSAATTTAATPKAAAAPQTAAPQTPMRPGSLVNIVI